MKLVKYTLIMLLLFGAFGFTNRTERSFKYRNIPNKAFSFGEELNYRVHYGWISAATVSMKVDPKPEVVNGRNTYHITTYGKTKKSFDWAYRVRDHFETNLDMESMAPLKYFKSVQENKYRDTDLVFYDHEKKRMRGKKKNMDMPEYVQDIVSATFYARTLDYQNSKTGTTFPINVYLDQKIYELKFKYMGIETIKTDLGKIKCYKLRPQLVVDRVFKDEDDMTVWISADQNKVPVRIQTDIWVGSLKVDLVSYKNLSNSFTSKK